MSNQKIWVVHVIVGPLGNRTLNTGIKKLDEFESQGAIETEHRSLGVYLDTEKRCRAFE